MQFPILPQSTVDIAVCEEALAFLRSDIFSAELPEGQAFRTRRGDSYSFGHSVRRLKNGNKSRFILPDSLKKLRASCTTTIRKIDPHLLESNTSAEDFSCCIVNQFRNGNYLPPHVDVDDWVVSNNTSNLKFKFGAVVIGVILVADPTGNFYIQNICGREKQYDPQQASHINERTGAMYALAGDTRHAPWHHGVSTVSKERISVTFRTVKFQEPGGP